RRRCSSDACAHHPRGGAHRRSAAGAPRCAASSAAGIVIGVAASTPYGMEVGWSPAKPRLRPARLLAAWVVAAVAVGAVAAVLPGVALTGAGSAFLIAATIALLNAVLPPAVAALRLPFTLVAGFLLVLAVDALALKLAHDLFPDRIRVDSFGDALLAAVLISAVGIALQVVLGTNDDDEYTLRVTRRIA